MKKNHLSPELVENILTQLGLSGPPSINIAGLTSVYRAWCRRVPFDNIRKRIHLTAQSPLPLPGYDDAEFFRGWLGSGVGGLCWAGNAALHALLKALGFSCSLGTATMLTDANQPPNHGTVSVQLEGDLFLVDASILHETPLLLHPERPSAVAHPSWGVSCSPHRNVWNIRWRPLHMTDGCDCRIEELSVPRDIFREFNEITRTQSPFNDSLYVRINSTHIENAEECVMGISQGKAITFNAAGEIITSHLSRENRLKYLVEQVGIKEEIAAQIPPDR